MANRGILALVAATALALVPATGAQAQVQVVNRDSVVAGQLDVPVNKSQVLRTDRPYGKALLGNPAIADIVPLTSDSLYVLGKTVGATSLTLYDKRGGLIAVMDIAVGPDVTGLKRQLAELMPADRIGARIANDSLVLDGVVSSSVAADKAMQLAETYAPGKVVNMMSLGSSQQVMLEVRFSEVRRSALKDIGVDFFVGNGGNFAGAVGSGASLTPGTNGTGVLGLGSIADSFGILTKRFGAFGLNFDAALNALEARGAITTLAEPTLVALSGETANFLAGGEFPIPVVQNSGSGTTNGITIEYKPFGVSLAFTPTVLADGVISMIVAPEVSSLDPSASIEINGLTIPGLQTRRAKTTVELRDGESFALAGLLRRDFQDQVRQMPILGSLPIIGTLFRSTSFQKNDTELVITVTPRLVRPVRAGVLKLPTDTTPAPAEPNLFLMGETVGSAPAQPLPPPPPPPASAVIGDAGQPAFDPSRLETPHGHRI